MGDSCMAASPSCSPPLCNARRELGTRSPFLRLPLLYVVRVDLFSVCPGGFGGRIGISSEVGTSMPESCDERAASRLILRASLEGSFTSSSRLARLTPIPSSPWSFEDRLRSSRSAPSWYSLPSSTWRDSIDFLRLRLPPLPGSAERDSPPKDERLIVLTLSWMNVLNSFGASSGCSRAGTQNNLEGSSSSSSCDGAIDTAPKSAPKLGRSGSMELTSIDIRRIACRLLSS